MEETSFFRPAPLWLSPGRRTLSCWWTNYANAFTVSLFGGSKVEQNHYKVVPVPKRKTNKDTTKNKHPQPTPQTTPNKNKTQKGTWHDGSKKQWHQVLLNYQILHKTIKTTNKKTTAQDHAKVFSKTHRPAMPKPRIPPARIPEIALRSLPA